MMAGAGIQQNQQITTTSTGPMAVASKSVAINAHINLLLNHLRNTSTLNKDELYRSSIFLAKGIDYAMTNKEVPERALDIPMIVKQVYQHRDDNYDLRAAITVLMLSVKNACGLKWFSASDSVFLTTLADEISGSFCTGENISSKATNDVHVILQFMSRFYPRMKMGRIVLSLEAKPGYETLMADFYISKDMAPGAPGHIRLFVVQTDNMETSSCLISPPFVNFLVNGQGIEGRTNFSMDSGPQFPTDITKLLRCGSNIIQAIGQFNGNYIIAIAFTEVISSSDTPVLQDYVQPDSPMSATDEMQDVNGVLTGQEAVITGMPLNTSASVVDLTMEENDTEIAVPTSPVPMQSLNNHYQHTCETLDRKPSQATGGISVSEPFSETAFVGSIPEMTVQTDTEVGDGFWSNMLSSTFASDGVDTANTQQVGEPSATDELQIQIPQHGNSMVSNGTERWRIPRHITYDPIAVQALPAQSLVTVSRQRTRMGALGSNSAASNCPPQIEYQTPISAAVTLDTSGPVSCNEMQQLSRPSSSQLHSAVQLPLQNQSPRDQFPISNQASQQVIGLPALTQRTPPDPLNAQRWSPINHRMPYTTNQPASMFSQPLPLHPAQHQQTSQSVIALAAGGSTNTQVLAPVVGGGANQLQTSRALPPNGNGQRLPAGDQIRDVGPSGAPESLSEQNWQPTGRMRGSLTPTQLAALLVQQNNSSHGRHTRNGDAGGRTFGTQ
ncbi:hypothetical protein QJS10_CPA03g00286 [Acorus calamus]|uniref:Uncharacterized protein n=1 Tax=Acorus calamus TaxID=4465 RepID=A0AAV9F9U3_ACOCL|nr:hypothetical protein QJS10_CPA03g00286 [Acorus calamus]